MPVVHIQMIEGRPPEAVREMIARVGQAVMESLSVPPDSVRIIVTEVPRTHYAVGGVPAAERPPSHLTTDPSAPRG